MPAHGRTIYDTVFTPSIVRQGAASGVRVNSVVPGIVETPIYSGFPRDVLVDLAGATQVIGRPIQPEEVRNNATRTLMLAGYISVCLG